MRAGATALGLQSRPQAAPGDDANPPRGVAELLLVTRLVRGLDGREFESYLGVYASEGKDWMLLEGDGIGAGDTSLQGRVLWVQVVPALFGQAFARNTLWTLWLRRPVRSAARRTLDILGSAPKDAATFGAVLEALRGLPWVLSERRVVPAAVERGLRSLEESQRHSPARRYVS